MDCLPRFSGHSTLQKHCRISWMSSLNVNIVALFVLMTKLTISTILRCLFTMLHFCSNFAADAPLPAKLLAYNRANRQVAILCNHQRAAPKNFEKQMENLQAKVFWKFSEMLKLNEASLLNALGCKMFLI